MRMADSIFVFIAFDLTKDSDMAILIEGKKKKGDTIDILNAFNREEIIELYEKLTASDGSE